MEATIVLDKVTDAIERVLKTAKQSVKTEQMDPGRLLAYAISQIEKAAKETPSGAARRLRALGETVEKARQAFVDNADDSVAVEIFEEETTAATDSNEKETSLLAAAPALGSSAFAENAEDLNKALTRLGSELEALRAFSISAQQGDAIDKGEEIAWPFDMNTREFRDGVKKVANIPMWGDDPDGLRTLEA